MTQTLSIKQGDLPPWDLWPLLRARQPDSLLLMPGGMQWTLYTRLTGTSHPTPPTPPPSPPFPTPPPSPPFPPASHLLGHVGQTPHSRQFHFPAPSFKVQHNMAPRAPAPPAPRALAPARGIQRVADTLTTLALRPHKDFLINTEGRNSHKVTGTTAATTGQVITEVGDPPPPLPGRTPEPGLQP